MDEVELRLAYEWDCECGLRNFEGGLRAEMTDEERQSLTADWQRTVFLHTPKTVLCEGCGQEFAVVCEDGIDYSEGEMSEQIRYGGNAESILRGKELLAAKMQAVAEQEPKRYGFWEIIAAALPAIFQALTSVVSGCAGNATTSPRTPEQVAKLVANGSYSARQVISRAVREQGCFCEDCNCGACCNQATELIVRTFRSMDEAERVDTVKLALDDASGKYDLL